MVQWLTVLMSMILMIIFVFLLVVIMVIVIIFLIMMVLLVMICIFRSLECPVSLLKMWQVLTLNSRTIAVPLIDQKSQNNSQKNHSHHDPDADAISHSVTLLIDDGPVLWENIKYLKSRGMEFTKHMQNFALCDVVLDVSEYVSGQLIALICWLIDGIYCTVRNWTVHAKIKILLLLTYPHDVCIWISAIVFRCMQKSICQHFCMNTNYIFKIQWGKVYKFLWRRFCIFLVITHESML